MKQIVTKNGRRMAVTTVGYPPETVKQMKKAGYQVKEVKDGRTYKQNRIVPRG